MFELREACGSTRLAMTTIELDLNAGRRCCEATVIRMRSKQECGPDILADSDLGSGDEDQDKEAGETKTEDSVTEGNGEESPGQR